MCYNPFTHHRPPHLVDRQMTAAAAAPSTLPSDNHGIIVNGYRVDTKFQIDVTALGATSVQSDWKAAIRPSIDSLKRVWMKSLTESVEWFESQAGLPPPSISQIRPSGVQCHVCLRSYPSTACAPPMEVCTRLGCIGQFKTSVCTGCIDRRGVSLITFHSFCSHLKARGTCWDWSVVLCGSLDGVLRQHCPARLWCVILSPPTTSLSPTVAPVKCAESKCRLPIMKHDATTCSQCKRWWCPSHAPTFTTKGPCTDCVYMNLIPASDSSSSDDDDDHGDDDSSVFRTLCSLANGN